MQEFSVGLPGREEIKLTIDSGDDGIIKSAQLTGVGGPGLLKLMTELRPQLKGQLSEVPLPQGSSAAAILLRELLLKAKGEWNYPFNEEELCHCRAVEAKKVDMAVIIGAHTPEEVSAWTSASTACGTCRPDVEAIIQYRLKSAS